MKTIIGVLVLVAVLVGGFFLFNNYIYEEKQAEFERETISGVVTAVNLDNVTFDGPAVVTVQTDSGGVRTVEVPSMGLPLCEAYENIADVFALEVGDRVEVTGNVHPETNSIIPCESVEHHLRATATLTNSVLGLEFNYRRGPDGYVLQIPPHGNEEEADFEELYILMRKVDYDQMQNLEGTEGPPTITVAVFRNPDKQGPEAWASTHGSLSNIGLKVGDITETTIGGADAIRFTADGLYRLDTVVVIHGGFTYLISGAYLEEESSIREDFQPLLNSIRFLGN